MQDAQPPGENVRFLSIVGKNKELETRLAMDGKRILGTHANALLIFALDERLKGILAFDRFTLELRINRPIPVADDAFLEAPGPYPRAVDSGDQTRILVYLQKFYSDKFKLATVQECLPVIAQDNGYHPICDWLAGLEWDKKPRLDQWLTQCYGAPLDAYHKATGSRFLIAAVRRVRHPGCKFDQMLVLEGPQGIGKSTSLSVLFGKDWFTDQIDSLTKKESAMDLRGKWCAEFSEIEHLIRAEVETVKAFLSRSVDHYRAPWARASADFPRQCVLVGTTNSTEYLRDVTGNRRIWPVRCNSVGSIDKTWLTNNRDQLWAEAACREASGEKVWFEESELQETADAHQKVRMYEDPWTSKISEYLVDKQSVTSGEILSQPLGLASQHQNKSSADRVCAILTALGWVNLSKYDPVLKKSVRKWRSHTQNDDVCEVVCEE